MCPLATLTLILIAYRKKIKEGHTRVKVALHSPLPAVKHIGPDSNALLGSTTLQTLILKHIYQSQQKSKEKVYTCGVSWSYAGMLPSAGHGPRRLPTGHGHGIRGLIGLTQPGAEKTIALSLS